MMEETLDMKKPDKSRLFLSLSDSVFVYITGCNLIPNPGAVRSNRAGGHSYRTDST